MIDVHCIPVLEDNYIWLVRDQGSGEAAVVDPALGPPALAAAEALKWPIRQVWNTHWHPDHTGGNAAIKAATAAQIIGPVLENDKIPDLDKVVAAGDSFSLGQSLVRIWHTPGHTAGHILFHLPEERVLFAGDTLFAMGCGRLFEGTADQMYANMRFLSSLPDDTVVYCAHEYTASNGAFALTVEPENQLLRARMESVMRTRERGAPTVPTTIGLEKVTNPFMRAASVEEFATRRALKDKG